MPARERQLQDSNAIFVCSCDEARVHIKALAKLQSSALSFTYFSMTSQIVGSDLTRLSVRIACNVIAVKSGQCSVMW